MDIGHRYSAIIIHIIADCFMKSPPTTTLAQLTDIHRPPLPRPQLRELSIKRGLAFFNWHFSRKFMHLPETLAAIKADALAQSVDHYILSGDLVNLALRAEFVNGAEWMKPFGEGQEVSFVPGNHDYYGGDAGFDPTGELASYMTSAAPGLSLGGGCGPELPFVRVVNNVAVIGVNSGIKTPLFKAFGKVSEASLKALAHILKMTKKEGLFRCVIIHHPPLAGLTHLSRSLLNDAEFTECLKNSGCDLVVYGHNHRQSHVRLETCDGICHVVGTPSCSVGKAGRYQLARYNLFHISSHADGWETVMEGRGLLEDYGPVCDLGKLKLGA